MTLTLTAEAQRQLQSVADVTNWTLSDAVEGITRAQNTKRGTKVVPIPVTCACGQGHEIEITFSPGFGYMLEQPVVCPHCKRITRMHLPGEIVHK